MLVLQTKIRIPIDEPEELGLYFTEFEVTIKHTSHEPSDFEGFPAPKETARDGTPQAYVGRASCTRLHIWNAGNKGVDLFDVCDSVDQHGHELYCAFLQNESGEDDLGFYQELPELHDCCTGDLLLIDDIELVPEYQGRAIELAVADRLIDTLGSQCNLVVFYLADRQSDFEWLRRIGFGQLEKDKQFAFRNEAFHHPIVREVKDQVLRFEAIERKEVE